MNLNEYQDKALVTAIYPRKGQNLEYTALGLAGEAGEFCNKVKKIQRDHLIIADETIARKLVEELGDLLWYVAAAAEELGWALNEVAQINLDKLHNRHMANTLKGEGDNR